MPSSSTSAIAAVGYALEKCERSGLSDGDAVACDIEGAAGRRRGKLQGVKAVQRGEAQRIHAAHQRRIDEPRLDHAPCRAEYLGAGCACAGHRDGGTVQTATAADVVSHRK